MIVSQYNELHKFDNKTLCNSICGYDGEFSHLSWKIHATEK